MPDPKSLLTLSAIHAAYTAIADPAFPARPIRRDQYIQIYGPHWPGAEYDRGIHYEFYQRAELNPAKIGVELHIERVVGRDWPKTVAADVYAFKPELEQTFAQRVQWYQKLYESGGYGWAIVYPPTGGYGWVVLYGLDEDAAAVASAMQTLIALTHHRLSEIIQTLPPRRQSTTDS